MNYCSIEDAWGHSNQMSNQFKEYMTNTFDNQNNNITEHFTENLEKPQPQSQQQAQQHAPINSRLKDLDDCDSFLIHIKHCTKCYNKLKHHNKSQVVEHFQDIIDDNKDVIVLILFGISILLFFNLINNLTKN